MATLAPETIASTTTLDPMSSNFKIGYSSYRLKSRVSRLAVLSGCIARRPGLNSVSVVVLFAALTGLCTAQASNNTITSLQLSSGAVVGSGVVITLTATVTTGHGVPVSRGFVTFCDASARYCEDLAILGTAAVNSGGVASMKKVLAPGTHKISASFNPTVTNATSTSSIQTVDVPVQVKALPVPIIAKSGTSNPLPVQASVSVVGTAPLTGTLSIVQDQSREALVVSPISQSTAQSGFAPLVNYAYVPLTSGGAAVAGDFNSDGLLDLAGTGTFGFSEGTTGYLGISLNDPTHPGQFLSGQLLSAGPVSGLVAGDFNNDGVLDLVVDNQYLMLGDPAHPGQFLGGNDAILVNVSMPGNVFFYAAADLNHDGVLDLIGSTNSGPDILYGDPAHPGQFINETALQGGFGKVQVADLNGDGFPDLVLQANSPAGIEVFLADSAHPGQFLAPVAYPLTNNAYMTAIVIGDFNQDGHPDVITLAEGNNLAGDMNVFLNNPSSPGHFLTPVDYTVNSSNALAVGDFNGDGFLDLAMVDITFRGISVLPGDPAGNGEFLPAQSYPSLTPPTSDPNDYYDFSSLIVADLNADGLSDLVPALELSGDDEAYFPINTLLAQETQTASVWFSSVTYDPTKSPLAQALYSGDENYDMIGSCNIDLAGSLGAPVLYDIHADVDSTDASVLWYWHGAVGALDYGTTTALDSTTGWKTAEPSKLNGPSFITLTGLTPGTKYYYRIRAIDYFSGCSHWTTTSPIETFTTVP